jgi:hypothetical protein
MEEKKRRQHYVFQSYLNAWTNEEKLWCMRNKKNKFETGTINVAQERDFYRIKPLNEDEKKFCNLFLNRMSVDVKKAMSSHMNTYLKPIELQKKIELLKHFSIIKFGSYDRIPNEIKDDILKLENEADISINNAEEDYHSEIESEAIRWINLLKEENTSFYYDNDRFDFIFFICTQYFRTKALKDRWISRFGQCFDLPKWNSLNIPKENIHLENLAHHFFWYIQNSVAYTLEKNNAHLTVLVNETDVPFITSDQPIINLCTNYQQLKEETKELVFYYPISPNIAITINDRNMEDKIKISLEKVDEYNSKIVDASYQFIFADSSEVIQRYISN